MMRLTTFCLLLAVNTPALAQVRTAAAGPVRYYSSYEYQMMYRHELKQLRNELLRQQRADGGKLSAASLNRYQNRLDKLNAGYRRNVDNNNPMSVDATGAAVAR